LRESGGPTGAWCRIAGVADAEELSRQGTLRGVVGLLGSNGRVAWAPLCGLGREAMANRVQIHQRSGPVGL